MVCIDPTYPNLISNWTMIPISVVGPARELLSGGVIFCSNVTSEVYFWIVQMLTKSLPCKNILCTICSDDDPNLEAAWDYLDQNTNVHRIICIWHKIKNLKEEMKKVGMNSEDQNKVIEIFLEMAYTRNEDKCLFLLNKIKSDYPAITSYMNYFQEQRLCTSTKAFTKDKLTLGYISNVFSESHNSSIKQLLGSRSLTPSEMRDVVTKASNRRKTNKEYIKKRKGRKALDSQTIDIMQSFKVEKTIAESIVGSIKKIEFLEATRTGDNKWEITEEKTLDTYKVTNDTCWKCSCGKLYSIGLPCSHILKVMKGLNINLSPSQNLISKRWILSEQTFNQSIIEKFDEISLLDLRKDQPKPKRKRYIDITSKMHSIAELGSINEENYKKTMSTLSNLENDFLGIKAVKDAKAIRCGRPRTQRLKAKMGKSNKVIKCQICKKNHLTIKCQYLQSVRKFINFKIDTSPSKKHCAICRSAGHFAKKCPALKMWEEAQTSQIIEKEYEEDKYSSDSDNIESKSEYEYEYEYEYDYEHEEDDE